VTLLYAALALFIWSRGAAFDGSVRESEVLAVENVGEVMKSKLGIDAGMEFLNGLPRSSYGDSSSCEIGVFNEAGMADVGVAVAVYEVGVFSLLPLREKSSGFISERRGGPPRSN